MSQLSKETAVNRVESGAKSRYEIIERVYLEKAIEISRFYWV